MIAHESSDEHDPLALYISKMRTSWLFHPRLYCPAFDHLLLHDAKVVNKHAAETCIEPLFMPP